MNSLRNSSPAVSVVMPVLNGEKYLRLAIESVLNQTFSDFEFIIINDGSTDETEKIINSYNDPRIKYIQNSENLGLSKSFNIGIRATTGELIARMDADDISVNDRLEKQVKYLKNHLDISILGSAIIRIDESGQKLGVSSRPTSHEGVKWQSLFSTPLFHPTVMARAVVLKGNLFDENLHNSEDYELWSRLLFTTSTRFANLREPLLRYRVFSKSFTQSLGKNFKIDALNTSIINIERYVSLTDDEKLCLTNLRMNSLKLKDFIKILNLYRKIRGAFRLKEGYRPSLANQVLFLTKYYLKRVWR